MRVCENAWLEEVGETQSSSGSLIEAGVAVRRKEEDILIFPAPCGPA